MTSATVKLIPSPEAAYLLRAMLGPLRCWAQWLADVRRNRVSGLVLRPFARLQDKSGHWLPAYRAADLAEFVRRYKEEEEQAKPGIPPAIVEVEHDLMDDREWKMRKLKPAKP